MLWTHAGEKIANTTLVLGDSRIFFADSAISAEQRRQALDQRRRLAQTGIYRERQGVLEELNEKKQLRAKYLEQKKALVEAQGEDRRLDGLIRETEYLIAWRSAAG